MAEHPALTMRADHTVTPDTIDIEEMHMQKDSKKCNSCRMFKEFNEFNKGNGSNGLHAHCKYCRKLARCNIAPHQVPDTIASLKDRIYSYNECYDS